MALPDASEVVTDPATAGAALAAEVAADAGAAQAQANDSLKAAAATVDALAAKIRAGIDAAAAAAATPREVQAPVAPAPVFGPEVLATMCEQAGLPKAAAGVFVEFAKNVVLPIYSGQITAEAKRNKRDAERDPELGPLMKRYSGEITAMIKSQGITDAYLAEHGYDKLARLAASEDPAYFEERIKAEVAKRAPAPAPAASVVVAPAGPVPRPPVEGVASSAAAGIPRAPKNRDEEIAAVQVTREEVDAHREMFHMTEKDLKKERLEIAEWQRTLGPVGLKQAGGIPICSIADIFPNARRA